MWVYEVDKNCANSAQTVFVGGYNNILLPCWTLFIIIPRHQIRAQFELAIFQIEFIIKSRFRTSHAQMKTLPHSPVHHHHIRHIQAFF